MRRIDHETVLETLRQRGFSTVKIGISEKEAVDAIEEPDAKTADVLDWLEINTQVKNGLLEDTEESSDYDFTRLITYDEDIVGRMMYYMVSYAGENYSYEDLVSDIEHLANTAYYDAPFDTDQALDAKPKNYRLGTHF